MARIRNSMDEEVKATFPVFPILPDPKKAPAKINLIRHAEGDINVMLKILNETTRRNFFRSIRKLYRIYRSVRGIPAAETGLTEEGRVQAAAMGRILVQTFGGRPDVVFLSPWKRVQETWWIVYEHLPELVRKHLEVRKSVHVHQALKEMDFGGSDFSVYSPLLSVPRAFLFDRRRKKYGIYYSRPPNGISWEDRTVEIGQLWEHICSGRYAGENVCIIGHILPLISLSFMYIEGVHDVTAMEKMYEEADDCWARGYEWDGEEFVLKQFYPKGLHLHNKT